MKYIAVILTVAFIATLANPVFATDCTKAMPVTEGDTVTCTGILVPASDVRRMLEVEAELKAATQKLAILDTQLKLTLKDVETAEARMYQLQREIDKPTPWYQSAVFWGPVGFIAGVVITGTLAIYYTSRPQITL